MEGEFMEGEFMSRSAASTLLVKTVLLFLILSPPLLVAQPPAGDVDEIRGDSSLATEAGEERPRSSREPESLQKLNLESALAEAILSNGSPSSTTSFGLGLFYFSDQQTSLQNSFSQSTVTLQDRLHEISSTTVLEGDPTLNNRKFDFELLLRGAGVYSTVELPAIPRFGATRLIFEIAETDVTFDILDTTAQSSLSSSFEDSGLMYGAGFDVKTDIAGKLTTGWGYRYRYLPSIDVDRSVSIGPLFEVLADDVSLSRESHELATRFFYAAGLPSRQGAHSCEELGSEGPERVTQGWSYRPFTGLLARRVEIEIEDRLQFIDGFEQVTDLKTVSRFESDSLLGVLGVDARLGSISGSLESFFGDGDYGVRFQVGWSFSGFSGKSVPGGNSEEKQAKQARRTIRRSQKRVDKRARRLERIYPGVLLNLKMIEEEFLRRWRGLTVTEGPGGDAGHLIDEVQRLIEDTEYAILKILKGSNLEPARDYVSRKAAVALRQLRNDPPATVRHASPRFGTTVFAVMRGESADEVLAANGEGWCKSSWCNVPLRSFHAVFSFLGISAGCPGVDLTFNASLEGVEGNPVLEIQTYAGRSLYSIPAGKTLEGLPLALYAVKVFRSMGDLNAGNAMKPHCPDPNPKGACALELMENPCPELRCESSRESAAPVCLQWVGEKRPSESCLNEGNLTCLKKPEDADQR